MVQQQVLRGKWEDILQHTAELSDKEVLVTVIEPADSPDNPDSPVGHTLLDFLGDSVGAFEGRDGYNAENLNDVVGEGGTMLDFFSGYVGVVNSSEIVSGGAKMSEDIERKFTEGMLKKRQEGKL